MAYETIDFKAVPLDPLRALNSIPPAGTGRLFLSHELARR